MSWYFRRKDEMDFRKKVAGLIHWDVSFIRPIEKRENQRLSLYFRRIYFSSRAGDCGRYN